MVNSTPPQSQPTTLDTITNNEPPTSASGEKSACELSATTKTTTTTTSTKGKQSQVEETNNNNNNNNNNNHNHNFVVVVDGSESDKLNSTAAAAAAADGQQQQQQQLDLVTSSAVSSSSSDGGGRDDDMLPRANNYDHDDDGVVAGDNGAGQPAGTCCAQPPQPQVQNSSSDSISRQQQQLLANETTTTTAKSPSSSSSSAAKVPHSKSSTKPNNQTIKHEEEEQVQVQEGEEAVNRKSPLKQPGGIGLVAAAATTTASSPSANGGIPQKRASSKQSATIVIGGGGSGSAGEQLNSSAEAQSLDASAAINSQRLQAPLQAGNYCKQRRLTYLQLLLIRKWPYLALSICIMGALIFGILLSGLTVLLLHGVQSGDCSAAAATRASSAAAGQASPLLSAAAAPHEFGANRRPLLAADFEAPIEMVAHLSPPAAAAAAATDSSAAALASGPSGPMNALGSPMNGSDQSAAAASLTPGGPLRAAGQSSRFQRLPSAIAPIHYDLFVQPFLYEPFNFTGKVSIRIKCIEATDNITLHALDLDINSASITLSQVTFGAATSSSSSSGAPTPTQSGRRSLAPPKIKAVSQDRHLQHTIIRLDGRLEPGLEYLLAIDFVGFLNDDLAGFYKIKYDTRQSQTTAVTAATAGGQQSNGTQAAAAAATTTWIAATQFQATDARRAFPCFDEPLYKATFSIKIKHWKNMTSLSNMPIIERQNSADGHWVTDVFEKSHRMSTYLVAFAVTNFESRSEGNISVWTRPGFAHTAEYSLRIAGKLLRYYEDFFGIEYPLPKMDMIALPDFNAGAMENWGLITYRETSMLFDESGSSVANKQRVATVVAHELAHQWFGNLVTPKWWDDLWLNEGFASYVEYLGVDHIEPGWKILDQFATEELQNVFRVDELSSSHQISIPVNDPEEISEIFDHISYAKSASVIRMMHHFLTPEVFKEGLRRYLGALKYSNAEQSDLWAHLTEASRLIRSNSSSSSASASSRAVDVAKVMNSWTLQVGYPLVTLTRQYDGSRRAKLDQIRYSPYKLPQQQQQQLQSKQPEQKWEVPITYTWKSELNFEPNTRIWLHQNDTGPVDVPASQMPASDGDWMLVNLQQVGYYRVNYDLQNWKLLIEQLNRDHRVISTTNRAQLLDDLFELARSGAFDYKFALEATKYLKSERDFLPWDTVLTSFGYIDDMLQRTPIYGQWQDYVSDLIRPYYARYKDSEHWLMQRPALAAAAAAAATGRVAPATMNDTSTGNDALEQYNLVNAISWACQLDQHCISKAKSLFRNWKENGKNDINPVVRFTVYCTAIDHGTKDDWNFLWRAYEKEQNSSERDRILKALSCSKQIWILSRYLEWTFNKSKPIRRQDGAYIFRMIAKNNYGRDIAFNFVRERWTTIREHYGKTSFSLGALIRSLSNAMNTQVELNQLMNFYESVKSDVGTGKRSFQNAIEEVETNVLWRNRNYKILEDWLNEAQLTTTTTTTATTLPGQQL